MKVGIITFHASHNYGSMLQAYALQSTIIGLGHECEIINFRTLRQKNFYKPSFFKKSRFGVLKVLMFPLLAINDLRKHKLFEKFLNNQLIITRKEYATSEELASAGFNYDAYISGSDQIWNSFCFDFDWAYYLDFVKQGRRIAYAPSMGPYPEEHVNEEHGNKIAGYIKLYDTLSVRELNSANRIEKISGVKIDTITLDPTLLLSREQWELLAGNKPLINGEYIFMYSPWYSHATLMKSAEFARKTNRKVVVSQVDVARKWLLDSRIKFHTAVGPIEFLNLIRNADLVVANSFHAFVFSIIFNRKIVSFDGIHDSRVRNLLNICGIDDQYLKSHEIIDCGALNLYERLSQHKELSIKFLQEALS